jgi:hypothetical protein
MATSASGVLPLSQSLPPARILIVVEGPHDIEFLSRISTILSLHDTSLPNLADRLDWLQEISGPTLARDSSEKRPLGQGG